MVKFEVWIYHSGCVLLYCSQRLSVQVILRLYSYTWKNTILHVTNFKHVQATTRFVVGRSFFQ